MRNKIHKKKSALLYSLQSIVALGMISFQAQATIEQDFQSWFNLTTIGHVYHGDKNPTHFKYWLEAQQRFGEDSTHATQTLFRPGLGYVLIPDWSLWLGYAWIYTSRPLTKNPYEENRIWQQLLWSKKNNFSTFTSRTRTEQRYLENNPKTTYRIRQFFKWVIPFANNSKTSFVSSNEVFWHKNNNEKEKDFRFDQNRFFIGISYGWSSELIMEIGYLNQYIQRVDRPSFLANILSITFAVSA